MSDPQDDRLVTKFRRFINSKFFLIFAILLFFSQVFWFAGSIGFGIPADETEHLAYVQTYAQRQITEGPIIDSQPAASFITGDVERRPGYLYHYLLSFPLKLTQALNLDPSTQIFLLRAVNIALAAVSLWILFRILAELRVTRAVNRVTVFALANTGMFVWGAASINHDNLAILFFFLMVLFSVKFIGKNELNSFLLAGIYGLLLILTKHTFVPVVGITSIWLLWKLIQSSKNGLKKQLKNAKTLLLAIILLLVAIFVAERYLLNALRYGTFAPRCNEVHSSQDCSQNFVYSRNTETRQGFKDFQDKGGVLTDTPITFTGSWIDSMYSRLFFFFGHKEMRPSDRAEIVGFLALASIVLLLMTKKGQLIKSKNEHIIILLIVVYVGSLFFFNLNTYISLGQKYAFQGRYLIPILPFLYVYVFRLIRQWILAKKDGHRTVAFVATMLFMFIFFLYHSPAINYAKYTDESWREAYQHPMRESNGLPDNLMQY